MGALNQLKHAWNAFTNQDDKVLNARPFEMGASYGVRPDRVRLRIANERSIISSVYNRISIDASSIELRHVRLDENKQFIAEMDTGLNNCLKVEANLDQAASAFRQDVVMTMLDKGHIAIVAVDTSLNPLMTGGYDILTMRVGTVVQWYPKHVRVNLYNDTTGRHEELTLPKTTVAIIENPFYTVMNEPNSTLQRLIRKLGILDAVDEQSGSGKLDLIIQLPYVVKSPARQAQAEQRRKDIEFQLKGSQYGIAYTDGTEKVTQLNRPAENNLLKQVEYLQAMLYSQLGITPGVMDGTADEATMLNYYNRTIEPILNAIAEGMIRAFLTKTARTQMQAITYFRDPFKLVPIASIADIADKFSRNEILTANEMRQVIGFKPSADPKADKLQNSNMPIPSDAAPSSSNTTMEGDSQNGSNN